MTVDYPRSMPGTILNLLIEHCARTLRNSDKFDWFLRFIPNCFILYIYKQLPRGNLTFKVSVFYDNH